MRRVVVTGLGMVTPLGSGVDATWSRLLEGQSGADRISGLPGRRSRLPDRLPDPARRRLRRHLQRRRVDGAQGAAQGRSLHRLCHGGRHAGAARRRLGAEDLRGPMRDRRADRLRHRRHRRHLRGLGHPDRARPAPHLALLHSRPPHQPGRRLRLHRARPQGPEPRGGDRLLHRLPRHRRCRAADRARRCRGDGGRRHGIADQPPVHRGLRRLPGPVDELQRRPDPGLAPLRQGPRRLRHGRGRRRRGAGGIRARQGARRQDLRRGHRLRPVGRRLPHHLAVRGRRRRLSLHGGRPQARRNIDVPRSTTSTPTAPRPRSATSWS